MSGRPPRLSARRSLATAAVTANQPLVRLPGLPSSPCTIPENTPPFAARVCRRAVLATAPRTDRTPASHAPPEDARAHKHSELECFCQRRSRRGPRSWPQTGPNPTSVPAAIVRTSAHSPSCRTPVILPAMASHPRVPAPCTAHSTRIPTEAAPHAANSRAPTSPPA